ncbi:MAG TPA: hypothetical protein V6D29_12190 [Leptolyngbyaceae cyanobacterium]
MSPTDETEFSNSPSFPREESLFIHSLGKSATYEQSLYVAVGQKILLDRLNTGKDFCKLMLTLSLGAIPVYLLLFIMAIPYDSDVGKQIGVVVLSPALIFLLSAIIFAVGFLLVATRPVVEPASEIERTSRKIAARRNQIIALGSLCFMGASLVGMVAIIKAHL